MATPYKVPKDHRLSVGFWETGRGFLVHHMEIDKGKGTIVREVNSCGCTLED